MLSCSPTAFLCYLVLSHAILRNCLIFHVSLSHAILCYIILCSGDLYYHQLPPFITSYLKLSCALSHQGPYGTIQDHTGPYGTMLDHTGPYRTIRDHTRPYGTIPDHTGPYGTDWLTCAISRGACASKNNVRALIKYYFIVNILINSQNLTPASGVWTLCIQYNVYQPWPVYSSSASEVVLLKMF